MDGTIRDLAALRGTYRLIPETNNAIRRMLDYLKAAEVGKDKYSIGSAGIQFRQVESADCGYLADQAAREARDAGFERAYSLGGIYEFLLVEEEM